MKIDFDEFYPGLGMGEQLVGGWTFVFNEKRTHIIPYKPLPQVNLADVPRGDWQAACETDYGHFQTLLNDDAVAFPVGFAAYDFRYVDTKSGYNDGDEMPIKNKLITLTWAPDNLKPKVKMLVPSSLRNLLTVCEGFSTCCQLSDMDDALYTSVASKAKINL